MACFSAGNGIVFSALEASPFFESAVDISAPRKGTLFIYLFI